MKKLAVAAAVVALLGAGVSAQQAAHPRSTHTSGAPKLAASHIPEGISVDAQNKLVAQNCATCHSERMKAGELVLAGFDAAKIADRPDVAEKMIRKLRTGMMPPPGARRPDAATTKAFLDALEAKMDAAAARQPESRLAPVPAAEPRRIPACGEGSARHRRRRQRLPAARHDQPRLRQRRRRAGVFADADGKLSARREPDQPPRGRRSQRERHIGHLQDRPHAVRRCGTSTARRWARAAASRSCTRSRPTANTASRSRCTTSRSAASTAARRWRRWTSRSRSRCRSTASAPRCSISTCG